MDDWANSREPLKSLYDPPSLGAGRTETFDQAQHGDQSDRLLVVQMETRNAFQIQPQGFDSPPAVDASHAVPYTH